MQMLINVTIENQTLFMQRDVKRFFLQSRFTSVVNQLRFLTPMSRKRDQLSDIRKMTWNTLRLSREKKVFLFDLAHIHSISTNWLFARAKCACSINTVSIVLRHFDLSADPAVYLISSMFALWLKKSDDLRLTVSELRISFKSVIYVKLYLYTS